MGFGLFKAKFGHNLEHLATFRYAPLTECNLGRILRGTLHWFVGRGTAVGILGFMRFIDHFVAEGGRG